MRRKGRRRRPGRQRKAQAVTTIKATCPMCGEVDLTADDVLLRIGAGASPNTYGFSCPRCRDFIEKPADERVVRLLLSGGVMPTLVHVPAEVLEHKEGPPLTYDDLLDFHQALADDNWMQELFSNS